ncbi:hypothetical protein, partial [Methyloceanibacter marginalis]|uniref:hypothetical protein n=1 Tax=Methyloceanibacter marginalis TaxID=1774971 RepID=UPI0013011632
GLLCRRRRHPAPVAAGRQATVTGWGAVWDFQAFNNAMDVMAGRRTVSERRLLNDEELQAPRLCTKWTSR